MTASENRLLVVENADQGQPDEYGTHVFSIYDELQTYGAEDARSIFGEFSTSHLESSLPIPVYEIIWPYFCEPAGFDRPSLVYGILLSRRLSEYINEHDISYVTHDDISPFFRMILLDVGRQTDTETDVIPPRKWPKNLATLVEILVGIFPFLLDQLVSLLVRFVIRPAKSADILFALSVDRFDSVQPVIDETDGDYGIVVTPTTTAWLRSEKIRNILSGYETVPSNLFTTIEVLAAEIAFLAVKLPNELLRKRSLQAEFEATILQRYDVEFQWTTWWLTNIIFTASVTRSLLCYYVYGAVMDRTECDTVVINNLSPTGRAILSAGYERNLDLYHVPHTVVTPDTTQPPFGATAFVPGDGEKQYLTEHLNHITDGEQFVAVGRPYLSKLYAERDDYPTAEIDAGAASKTVAIATQPYPDPVRRTLVEDVITAVQSMDEDVTVIVKTHPSEDPEDYEFVEGYDFVQVKPDDLFSVLAVSDVILTINSNVGLETQVLGTPCVCVNKWEPLMWNLPYVDVGPVPVLRTSLEIEEFFGDLTDEKLASMKAAQQEYLESAFILDGLSSERIARCIVDGCTGAERERNDAND